METHHGDATGLGGAVFWFLALVVNVFNESILWLDQHSGAVVALCSIGGLILTAISVKQRREQLNRRDEKDAKELI